MVCTTVRGMPVFRPAQCSHAYARAHTTIPLSPTALFEKLLTLDFAAVLDQRISKIGAFLFAPCRFPHHRPPKHAVPWQHRVRATVHAVSPLVWLPVLQNAWPAWTTARTCCTCNTTRFSRSPPVMWCWCAAPCSAVDPATSWWRRWIPREIRYARARCGGCAGRTKKAHALTRHPTATDPHPEGMRPCYHQCIRLPHRHFPAGHRHGHHLRGECRRDRVAPHHAAEVHQHHAAAGGRAAHAPARVLHFPRVPGHADAAAVPC